MFDTGKKPLFSELGTAQGEGLRHFLGSCCFAQYHVSLNFLNFFYLPYTSPPKKMLMVGACGRAPRQGVRNSGSSGSSG